MPSASAAAFNDAAQRGAQLIEVDVRQTSDGVLVCVHDDEVPGLGPVVNLNFAALSEVDQDTILTLEQFCLGLDTHDPHRRSGVHLDLKDENFESEAVDRILSSGRPLFVTTPIDASIQRLRFQRPTVAVYLTIGTSRKGLSRAERVRLRVAETFPMHRILRCGATGIAIHYRLATGPLRWWCRTRNLAVVVWTVDRTSELERWLNSSVDVVTTNRPIEAIAIRSASLRSTAPE